MLEQDENSHENFIINVGTPLPSQNTVLTCLMDWITSSSRSKEHTVRCSDNNGTVL